MASVEFFKENNKNKNTTQATNTWHRTYLRWAEKSGRPSNLLTLGKSEMNQILEQYFAEIVRKDGKQYEPSSLGNMQAGIDRFLRENGSLISIMKDIEFNGSRSVLEGRAKYLRELGMGKKPNAADSFTKQEEDVLWNCGALGSHSGEALVNTMHMLLTKHLGLRGRQEHHVMCVEDFVFKIDESGDQYITFKEGLTKTRYGGTRVKTRKIIPKMFETRVPGRCPVQIFEQFILRRPADMRTSGVFYLAIIPNPAGEVWFKRSNLGENYIDNIVKNMVKKTPLRTSTKNFTNHAWRHTTTKRMRNAGASRGEVIEVTGHAHKSGLDPYDSGDDFQAKRMSYAIDGLAPPARQPVPPTPIVQAVPPPCLASAAHTVISASMVEPLSAPASTPRMPCVPPPPPDRNFRLLSDELYEKLEQSPKNVYNFYGCSNISLDSGNSARAAKTTSRRKRVMIVSDSESSQD